MSAVFALVFTAPTLFTASPPSVETASLLSVEKASILSQYGLKQEAKSELIDIIFSKSDEASKAQAYYYLGIMAFDEKKFSVALDSWRELTTKYPDSAEAESVKDRIYELAEIVGESAKETVDNAIALSYLRHGDFWSEGKGAFLPSTAVGYPMLNPQSNGTTRSLRNSHSLRLHV